MTINREHFEAWLFSQPKERTLNYIIGFPVPPDCNYDLIGFPVPPDCNYDPCLFCAYGMQHLSGLVTVSTEGIHLTTGFCNYGELKNFADLICSDLKTIFTIGDAQALYLKCFPILDPQLTSCGDGNETLPSKKQTESQIMSHCETNK